MSRSPARLATGLMAASALLALVYLWSASTAPAPGDPAAEHPDSIERTEASQDALPDAGVAGKAAPLNPVPAATPRVPALPDPTLSFGQQYAALLEAHQSGNTEASCRLVHGITECAQLQRSMEFVRARQRGDFPMGQAEEEGTPREAIVAVLARSLNYLEERGAACEGFVASEAISANEVLRAAGPRLSPAQKTLLAMTRPDGEIRRLNPPNRSHSQSNMYVYPQFKADHVLEFLEAGLRARHPLALEGLAMLHAPGNGIPAQGTWPTLPNPKLYARYAILLQELAGPEVLGWAAQELIAYSLASLSAAEVEQVRTWVARELPQWRLALGSYGARERLRDIGRTAASKDRSALCRP